MESDSQPARSSEKSTDRLADLIGTLIAVLTLTLPLLAIARYSPSQINPWPSYPPNYPSIQK
ncbi:hypothetical protein PCC9214_04808 [Planktothrix tepida]|uniref:Uncharacterized protein n=2 Tax=Planktothrix TaxID=54304 RepID=A0A1J1LMY1_9CYAN|nr:MULTISPECIES: hypothetical protein [Planktothrix]CAD5920741.1 hypothetical protein NO713_00645 [Planktothrix pseudagardhii]CAD5981469.1 hypothetical protein PCC9214_04808 [Planktothrix tepida]CUR33799.1 conserved hypothetical protein [Planktothrix tepida PCC 9214]